MILFCLFFYLVTFKCSTVNNSDFDVIVLIKKVMNNLDEISVWKKNQLSTSEVLFTSQFGVYSDELSYIMDLSRYNNDPLHVFQALKTDLVMERKQFKLLEKQLIQVLVEWYEGFDSQQRFRVDPVRSFYYEMAKFAGSRGYFDLVGRLLKDHALIKWYFEQENKNTFSIEFLKQVKETIKAHGSEDNIFKFVAGCYIYKAPNEIYEDFMVGDEEFVIKMAPFLVKSAGLNQEHFDDLNIFIQKHIKDKSVLHLSNVVNMILFTELDLEIYETDIGPRFEAFPQYFDTETLRFLAKIASSIGKTDLVARIFENKNAKVREYCKHQQESNEFDVKLCFDILGFLEAVEVDEILKNFEFFNVAINFYAVESFKIEKSLTVYLKASESMKNVEWIESLTFEFSDSWAKVLEAIWTRMKVDHLPTFLDDFSKLKRDQMTFVVPFEVIEALGKSADLQLLARKGNLKFEVSALDLLKLETGKFECFGLLKVVDLYAALHEVKDANELRMIEEYSGKTVADIVLEKEAAISEISEASYFALRPAFEYWRKGPEHSRIKEIKTRKIIELLKCE